ncbi:hypothetical protein L7F22_036698 [Adiantum nelumboides]|nr:hypothetical protein [Adiantum nelumboides]
MGALHSRDQLSPLLQEAGSYTTSNASAEKAKINGAHFSAATPSEPPSRSGSIDMYSGRFYAACAAGGILSCGLTHPAVTPLDLVKCNMQIDPMKYKSIASGFNILWKEQGFRGLFKGWVPTMIGYSAQGACKFGFYEFFKKYYSDLADTMMKFACFEKAVELIYRHMVPVPKNECTKPTQLAVSFAGGYVAGVFCAVISHPADNLVSFLNNSSGATVGDAIQKLGPAGLFTRGLPLRIVMIGALTGAQWGIYDAFKVFVGLPTTGGAVKE